MMGAPHSDMTAAGPVASGRASPTKFGALLLGDVDDPLESNRTDRTAAGDTDRGVNGSGGTSALADALSDARSGSPPALTTVATLADASSAKTLQKLNFAPEPPRHESTSPAWSISGGVRDASFRKKPEPLPPVSAWSESGGHREPSFRKHKPASTDTTFRVATEGEAEVGAANVGAANTGAAKAADGGIDSVLTVAGAVPPDSLPWSHRGISAAATAKAMALSGQPGSASSSQPDSRPASQPQSPPGSFSAAASASL